MDWYFDMRNEFPVLNKGIYFDIAFSNPNATCMVEEIFNFWKKNNTEPIDKNEWIKRSNGIRSKIASLIHGTPEGVAFTKNTTEGINIVAQGIDWKRGDQILVYPNEHPSLLYPWLNLRQKGVEVIPITVPDHKITIESIKSKMNEKTRVVAMSSVQYCTGYRADLNRIGSLCRQNEVVFVVDGIQSIGTFDIDVKKSFIDVLACGGHKGMLGPHGVGFLYISERSLGSLKSAFIGGSPVIKVDRGTLELTTSNILDARRFEYGYLNFAGLFGLEKGVDLISKYGINNIEQRVLMLSKSLEDGLLRQEFQLAFSGSDTERSGLVVVKVSHPSKFKEFLDKRKIKVSLMDAGVVRFSPYAYNTEEEVKQVLTATRDYKER